MSFPESPISIVRLDGIHLPSPTFSNDLNHTYHEYPLTVDRSTIIPRLQSHNATVAITTTVPITRAALEAVPTLKHIVCMAIGTDHVDLAACKELGVRVSNVPAASNESVAEHAFSLYFALRRRTVEFHTLATEGTAWKEKGSLASMVFGKLGFPESAREEVLGVIGVGELGMYILRIST